MNSVRHRMHTYIRLEDRVAYDVDIQVRIMTSDTCEQVEDEILDKINEAI